MKKLILILMFPLLGNILSAQPLENVETLINQGITCHDKGDYKGAIEKYDKALALEKDNLYALSEKAYSLSSLGSYKESIKCCEQAIKKHPGDKGLKTLYVTYGNALDALKKTGESIKIYNEGISLFPDFYQLYFNKGISLLGAQRSDEAMLCFQQAVMREPNHASSHNVIARLSLGNNQLIPALLAYCRFLIIEPKTLRAAENLASMQKIMKGNSVKTGDKSISVYINSADLDDTKKAKENNFSSTSMILQMNSALDYDDKYKNESAAARLQRKLETVCASLRETKKDNTGFFWEYYAPFFVEMKEKNMIEPFSYVALVSSNDPEVFTWLETHKSELEKFYHWSQSFNWKKE